VAKGSEVPVINRSKFYIQIQGSSILIQLTGQVIDEAFANKLA